MNRFREREGGEEPVGVFGQPPVAHPGEAELQLEQRKHVLDPRTGLALNAILLAHLFVDQILGAPAPRGPVLGPAATAAG